MLIEFWITARLKHPEIFMHSCHFPSCWKACNATVFTFLQINVFLLSNEDVKTKKLKEKQWAHYHLPAFAAEIKRHQKNGFSFGIFLKATFNIKAASEAAQARIKLEM